MLPPHQRFYERERGRRWRIVGIASLVISMVLLYSWWPGWGSPASSSSLHDRAGPAGLLKPSVSSHTASPAAITLDSLQAPLPTPPPQAHPADVDATLPLVPPTAPLLFIVVSASRPNGTDYASPLIASIFAGFRASAVAAGASVRHLRVLLYDADLPEQRRPDSFFAALPAEVEVHRAPSEALAELATVNLNPRLDKHRDPADRIRWRTKMSKDLECVLSLAHAQSSLGWPYAIVLQDDVQLSSTFFPRVRSILHSPAAAGSSTPHPDSDPWLAYVLFHAAAFDHGLQYADGAAYKFEACGQAIMYRTAALPGFVQHVSKGWRSDPDDWQLRDYQRASKALVRVAQPSIVQHIGRVSSLAAKAKTGGGIASGCWAPDFVE